MLELKLPSSLKFSTCKPNCCKSKRIYAQTPLPKRAVLSTTLSKILLSVGLIFTVLPITSSLSRPFSTRKASNRSSRYVLSNGQRLVNQILLLVRSRPWSNFSQTWSTLVNFGQTWSNLPKSQKMFSQPCFENS